MKCLYCFSLFVTVMLSGVKCYKPFIYHMNSNNKLWNILNKSNITLNSGIANTQQPLLLSPLIKEGKFEEAKNRSKVMANSNPLNILSYSGFITVDENFNSNLFFWYFPAKEVKPEEAPLIIWLQGGPGSSSMFGLFVELGPFSVMKDGHHLKVNEYSWHKHHNLLFIDQPVGTGFSFTDDGGYASNQSIIAQHLYNFTIQFMEVFSEMKKVPLYISGESYAAKYVPSFANEIHTMNKHAELKLNLKGVTIGDGFIDPYSLMRYSSLGYELGLIDKRYHDEIVKAENECEKVIDQNVFSSDIFSICNQPLHLLMNYSKIVDVYNYIAEDKIDLQRLYSNFLNLVETKQAIHVGDLQFSPFSNAVYNNLKGDFYKSAKHYLENLLENNYKVMVYGGQLDIIVGYPLSVRTYISLNWKSATKYLSSERKPWHLGKQVIGYSKKTDNFLEVMVRNAGHMVPMNQPERALLLIRSFINDWPLK